jgi:hypothetical protein
VKERTLTIASVFPVSGLFHPTENTDRMAAEIVKTEPVPLEDLTIEEKMLGLYCIRFGKNNVHLILIKVLKRRQS